MKKLKLIIIFIFFNIVNSNADEFNISALEINFFDDENKIIAIGEVVAKDNTGIIIYSDKATYFKNDEIIIAEGNAKANNIDNSEILAEKLIYDKKKKLISAFNNVKIYEESKIDKLNSDKVTYNTNTKIYKSFDETFVYLKDKYKIITRNAVYDKKKEIIFSKHDTQVSDTEGNYAELSNFKYGLTTHLLRSKGLVKITDAEKHQYFFDDIIIDTSEKKSSGTNLKVKFDKEVFDNEDQDPRLMGNTAEITTNISNIDKGVYTTCALKKGKCPPWKITAKKVIHDKTKKTIYYKNAWLNFWDVPVIYFPFYFHPDPTVKRQSGFLRPYMTSGGVGTAFNLPYYFALDDHKDLTIFPRIYENGENPLMQFEYRHVTEKLKQYQNSAIQKVTEILIIKKLLAQENTCFLRVK